MAIPTTEIHVANLALGAIGQDPISSISSPTTRPEKVVSRHFAATRRALLREFIFNFAKQQETLQISETVEPEFGWDFAYPLPGDFIRLLSLGNIPDELMIQGKYYDFGSGKYIYTDEESDDDVLYITYIRDETLVARWDSLFVKLMYLQLASDLVMEFPRKPSLVRELEAKLVGVRQSAASIAGQEKPPRRIQRSRLIDVRRYGGSYRDTTRYP